MRKLLFTTSFLFLLVISMIAQAPSFFNYQGVARNSVGNALVNKTIKLRITIRDSNPLGLPLYSETKIVTTNAFGLFNVQVGAPPATNTTGSMSNINWNVNRKWMQVEIDVENNGTFVDIGTTQLSSVPYSLHSNQSGDVILPFVKSQNEENPLMKITNTGNNASSLAFEGLSNSTANNATAIRGIISSPSPGSFSAGITGQNNGTTGNGVGVYGSQNGSGYGVYGTTPGGAGVYGNSTTGTGVYGQSVSGPSVMGYQPNTGTSNAGLFQNFSTTNAASVLRVLSNGLGEGLSVNMTGLGKGGVFAINNAANGNTGLEVSTNGIGRTGFFQNSNAVNPSTVFEVLSNGSGRVGLFQNTNAGSTAPALSAVSNGTGDAIQSIMTGNGKAGLFTINNASNGNFALDVSSNGTNSVINSISTGTGRAGFFRISNAANTSSALEVNTTGSGYAASFISSNASPKALRTVGAIQFTGANEGPGRILSTVDGSGTATWQNAASVGLVSGSGTTNFVPRWTPDGTIIGNSQIVDNGSNIGIAGAIDANYKVNLSGTFRVNAGVSNGAVAVFENTSSDVNSDGIVIKLGRTHTRWNGNAYANVPNPVTQGVETQVNQIRDWIYGNDSFSWDDLINLMPSQYLTGTVCNLTNYITQRINNAIGLPVGVPPVDVGYQMLSALNSVADVLIDDDWVTDIQGDFVIPGFQFPAIPQLNCSGLPSLSFPVFVFDDVNNSLKKTNEFVSFVDKDNRKLGAIRAQSIQDFSYDYFDGQKMLDLAAEFIGIDIVDDFMSIVSGISEMVTDYNNIGVEYSSGNGDYAEWLERIDPREEISYGDIVAVKGGKITKDLKDAQQIMAVSKQPIVLGNVPDAAKTELGNNIAFMGQIPVKVMGPVMSGDYIVAKSDIPGYGIAVHPKDMQIDDFKLAVGRSWDTNKKEGPKMVNTVVGVHNHDFLNIISGLQQKVSQTDDRLKAIESALNIKTTTTKEPVKKAFK